MAGCSQANNLFLVADFHSKCLLPKPVGSLSRLCSREFPHQLEGWGEGKGTVSPGLTVLSSASGVQALQCFHCKWSSTAASCGPVQEDAGKTSCLDCSPPKITLSLRQGCWLLVGDVSDCSPFAVCVQVAGPRLALPQAGIGLRLRRTRRDSFPNLRKCLAPDTPSEVGGLLCFVVVFPPH